MEKNYKVVFVEKGKVELLEWEMPTLEPDEVLVKTTVSQISTGTELTLLEANVEEDSPWKKNIVFPNYNPGYSTVGVIIDAGELVPREVIGKRCFHSISHQKYTALKFDEESVKIIPDSVCDDDAVFDAIGTVTAGSIRSAELAMGETVVVYGAGIIGQTVARLAAVAGATQVFVVDVSDERLKFIPDDPRFIAVNSLKQNVEELVRANTYNNEGAACVFETTSVSSLINEQIKCLRKRGKLIITSSPKKSGLVNLEYCSRNGIYIIGANNWVAHPAEATQFNYWTRKRDGVLFLELIDKKLISLKEMNTHRFNYKNCVDAYEMLMKDRTQALSVLFDWED